MRSLWIISFSSHVREVLRANSIVLMFDLLRSKLHLPFDKLIENVSV